jgi:hypothetical protein
VYQYIFHSLSSYSMTQTNGHGTLKDDVEPGPFSLKFVEQDPHSVGFAEPPPPVHARQSVSRRGGSGGRLQSIASGARLQSIAASIVHPTRWHTPRRVSRFGSRARKSSIYGVYEKAKVRGVELRRERWVQVLFEYTFYLVLVCFIYFVLIGVPLWRGSCAWLYHAVKVKFTVTAGFAVVVSLAVV